MGFDDEYDDAFLMLGFSGIDGLLQFVHWVYENFDDDEDFKNWFESNMDKVITNTQKVVPAITEAENDEFWNIVSKSFKNHKGERRDRLSGPD